MIILWDAKGGIGSGNWGHAGRKGVKGGSAPIANNSADKIYAGGQKYKQAGGKRSVTEKRKVAYNTKKDASNAESTVSDVSLPTPINTTPVEPQNTKSYLDYDKKIKQSLMSEVTSNVAKVKVLNEYATKTWQDATLTPDEKSGLASFIFTEKQSLLKQEADDAKDMLSSNVAILVNNGQPAMQSICSETTILLKGYDSAGLDTQSSN
jgi:hypothetical protein